MKGFDAEAYTEAVLKQRLSGDTKAIARLTEEMSEEELTAQYERCIRDRFKKRLEEGETLDDILPEAFAVVREAASRTLHIKHYRVRCV